LRYFWENQGEVFDSGKNSGLENKTLSLFSNVIVLCVCVCVYVCMYVCMYVYFVCFVVCLLLFFLVLLSCGCLVRVWLALLRVRIVCCRWCSVVTISVHINIIVIIVVVVVGGGGGGVGVVFLLGWGLGSAGEGSYAVFVQLDPISHH